ncbi:MAG: 2-C-methyl-D-erythritol 4-phosphate cytidylyltransferase [Bacteroidales bacterium]|jgi:2-C-methyl-D-erythritol 4-phosphate cytidylyltransferase|nr:2-C-methyl-D-erythritol 4-phosphate cytidylyltransferase [Bacteroidales bacterium]
MERRRYVIVMAAGSGTRMGGSLPKQFLEIGGKAILQKTIEVFLEACPGISVVTVLNSDYIQYWRDYCLKHNFTCPQTIVAGGFTRFHSVRNALEKIPEGAVVAVHDGVRPLVTASLVREMFENVAEIPALIPVVPCVDTLKVLQKDGDELRTVEGAVADRSVLYAAQTPQIFHSELLKSAYSMAYDTMFTDDASVVQKYGKSLSYTMGERLNIKITTQEDLLLARAVMSLRVKD